MSVTREDAKRFLVGLLPKGTTDWLDVESSVSNVGLLFYAHGGGWKTYGLDLVETLRTELNPATMIQKIPDWESALGLSQTPIAKFGTTAQRKNAVLSWLRQKGSGSLADIRAVVQPYFLYQDPSQIQILETSRSGLTGLHTYIGTGFVVPAGGDVSSSISVLDDPRVSPGGATLLMAFSCSELREVGIILDGPGGTRSARGPGQLGSGTLAGAFLTIHGIEHAGAAIKGDWEITVRNLGAGAVSVIGWAVFVEGIGVNYDGDGKRIGEGLGAAMFDWAVVADEDKLGTGYDLDGARRALNRLKPAHTQCTIVWRASGAVDACAIPDTRSALPDAAIPCS